MAETVKDALILWGEDLVRDLKQSIKRALKWKSGTVSDLEDSVRYEVNDKGTSFKLFINDYYYYVDKGRDSTKNAGTGRVKSGIYNWLDKPNVNAQSVLQEITQRYYDKNNIKRKAKKLPRDKAKQSLAFLIARKVHKDGFEAKPFYDSVVNQERINVLKAEVAKAMKEYVILEVKI